MVSSLPESSFPAEADATSIARSLSIELGDLSESSFTEDALWRDTFALTGTLRTFYTPAKIISVWRTVCSRRQATSFVLSPEKAKATRIGESHCWIDVPFTFQTTLDPATTASGTISIVLGADGEWKVWVLKTILEQLAGEPNVDELEPTDHAPNGDANGDQESGEFDVVIIGGGQAGLSAGGRMKSLRISYVVIDKNENVGDSWKLRYNSARLHTCRQYSHLPFNRTFPSTYQEWLTKDDLAQGYQDWVKRYGIKIWLSTSLISGKYDEGSKKWTLEIIRNKQQQTLTCSHVILAVGSGGRNPIIPQYLNKELFEGTALHSSQYTDAVGFKGKHGVVIGTANTAHDIAEDMLDAGLTSVTMVQRSPTYVLPYEYHQRVQSRLYNDQVSVEVADRASFSTPIAITRQLALAGMHAAARAEPERFDALEKGGFKLERYGDIIYYIYVRMGGHYMDVGASKKIAQGQIKMKTNSLPVEYTTDGVRCENGDVLPADLLVFATGFETNMKRDVRRYFGDVADRADDFWGVDEEGEILGAFKPTGHPGLWYHGGVLGHARFYSRFIALSIRAILNGTPFPVYDQNGYGA
ncbi:FAD/NAD(P)-binding domain-containing protein [Pleomassaria siparia CBS 279.74]|uniref:FAD/NAD(P)-binding domain-containing protein n=1 Tax=Pleomassaria siparia CBS 279.74 TaxID=1314801 RepID=A0A6G1JTX4_9PLEO|nr:FAD/NAD(P)-binding domain-containing protein [Pleomassaria siparia CBS 279.74]